MRLTCPRVTSLLAACFLVLTAPALVSGRPSQPPGLDDLDTFVAGAMQDWKVPGLAVAVVKDGKIILVKGYGYRDLERKLPVTPQTLFAIGSITKSFTVTTLGILVDEGKLDWDKPVRNFLPEFTLYDAVATERLTPRDLVTHRTGLPRHDLVWYSSDFSRADLVRRLRYLEPSKDIRQTFQYNNLMFMTAGYLAGQLFGETWESVVREKLLGPLGMLHTNFSVNDSPQSPDFAQPYQKAKEEIKKVPFHNIDQIGPAGSINSCVEDMARYLLMHMSLGRMEGKQILSENDALQMQTPQMVIQGAPQFSENSERSYGMGFFISTYRGHKLVEHGGAIDGFIAELAFLPQDKIGAVVLTNLDQVPLASIVANHVFDRLLGLEPVPWNQRFLEIEKKRKAGEEEAKTKRYTAPTPGTHPSHALADYAGEFENPGYGTVAIALSEGELKFTLNKLTSPLRPFNYEVFQIPENPLDPLEKVKVAFLMDEQGNISSLTTPLEPNVKEIVFTRVAEKQMRERNFLEPLAGQYEIPGNTLTVSLQGDHMLVFSLPGQPARELVPVRGTAFEVKGMAGFRIEFVRDAAGKVAEAVISQPGTTFVARRK